MTNTQWQFDTSHSNISFWIRHLVVSKVHGNFSRWSGTMSFDEQRPEAASVEVQIEAASIDTREPQRDEHLRSPDFFDVAAHPAITFRARGAEKTGEREYRMNGELTIRGVTRQVTLDVEYAGRVRDPWGNEKIGFSAKTSLNRKDFGLTWNQALEAGGVLVGDKVEINLEVQAKQAAAAAAA